MIEIKSGYTFNKGLEINLIKERAAKEQGYNFLFIIDKEYSEFVKFCKPDLCHGDVLLELITQKKIKNTLNNLHK